MRTRALASVVVALLVAGATAADEPTGQQAQLTGAVVIERARQAFYYPGSDMKTRITMELVDAGGGTRTRVMTMLRWDDPEGGDQKYFIYFHEPGDVRRMTFMVWKYPERDDDRWVFVPAVDLIRRIAADDQRSSFVGSDFTHEDLSGREVNADDHALLREEELDGRTAFVVESVPREPIDYIKQVSWIDKATFLPLREEYYDAQGELYRVFTADRIEETAGGEGPDATTYATVTQRTMANLKTGHRTQVAFNDIAYDVGLEGKDFTERSMRRPPRQWIR